MWVLRWLLILSATWLLPNAALAQTAAAPVLTPPALETFVEATRPDGADSLSGNVVLQLTIGPDGVVRSADVVESLEPRFDEAARQAVLQFRFRPATRDGTAIVARIRYRYVWRVAPAVLAPDDDPYETMPEIFGVLEVTTRSREGDRPLPESEIVVRNVEGTVVRAERVDTHGHVRFELAPGEYEVRASLEGYDDFISTEIVRDGEATELVYRLTRFEDTSADSSDTLTFEATAEVEPPPRDAARRVLEADVLTRIPGTRGDALRAVELLPGVGRPAFGGGNLIIRGSAPGDSQVFLDGNPVPLLYHFGGITSFYNSLLLERIDFIPGNFSARYGRKIGGILEVTPRDPRRDGFHGFVDLNIIDASFMVEGPIGPNLSVALAARRSYIDFFFANVVPRDLFSVLAAPVYYDYQAIVAWRPNTQHRLRLFVYGSSDELAFVFSQPSGENPNVRGNVGISTQFHRVQASWLFTESDNFEIDTSFGVGVNDLRFNLGDAVSFNGNFVPFNLRSEARWRLTPTVRLIGGIDWQYTPVDLRFRGPQTGQSEGSPPDPTALSTAQVSTASRVNAYRPGLYVETNVKPWETFEMVLGVRADYYREIADWSVDPRVTARWRLHPDVTLRGGVGMFSQPPEFQESAPLLGNPQLEPLHAIHVSLGSEYRPANTGFSASVDGFYKHLYDRVVSTRGSLPPFFENGGLGRIYGLEVAARLNPGTSIPLFGFLSYTLSRSERLDPSAANWRLFDFDQTHILTAAMVWTIGNGWEAGATFRLVSGNPLTPVIGAVNNAQLGTYSPLYGPVNSDRNPMFHRLDVRVEKLFRIGDGRLRIYLDIQNVYNAANREAVQYNYDYTRQSDVTGLPFLPSLGIRGEL